MSDRLRKQIAVERMQLSRLTQTYLSLIEKCKQALPEFVEISALSAFLHAFYTGIENIFKRVVVELGESLPEGELRVSEANFETTSISAMCFGTLILLTSNGQR